MNDKTRSLCIRGNIWEVLQHFQWMNGSYRFITRQISREDKFNLEICWLFRDTMAAVIGAIRLIDEGNNTRVIFISKPDPTRDAEEKFVEFFQRIQDYFVGSVINEDGSEYSSESEKDASSSSQVLTSNLVNINGNVTNSTIILGNDNNVQNTNIENTNKS